MEPKKRKRKAKYTVMVVSDIAEGKTKQYKYSSVIRLGALAVFLVLILVSAAFYYANSYLLNNSFYKANKYEKQIDELTEQNKQLQITNAEIVEKNSILSDTIVQKVEIEEAQEAQEAQKYVPNGIPVSRALSITEMGSIQTDEIATEQTEENTDAMDNMLDTEGNSTQNQGQVIMVEFLVKSGSEVMATGNGTILYVGDDDEYTRAIKVDHGNGYVSIYRYPKNAKVNVGDVVVKGDVLFELNTNNEKLGYQILYQEELIDPMELMEIYG